MTTRETLVELANKLFIYTDERNWEGLINEVFSEEVHLDMSSLGTPAALTTAKAICEGWESGFKGIDAINHLAGNYLVDLKSDSEAHVFCYATATHFRAAAEFGKTREFVGTYELDMKKEEQGWRITAFTYNLKYASGNMDLD